MIWLAKMLNSNGLILILVLLKNSRKPFLLLIALLSLILNFTTILTTDACDYALGAALSQKASWRWTPCLHLSLVSSVLTERRYSMWEKELFAIVWAVKYFRPYLLNHKFTIKSDNKPATQNDCKFFHETFYFRYESCHSLDTFLTNLWFLQFETSNLVHLMLLLMLLVVFPCI